MPPSLIKAIGDGNAARVSELLARGAPINDKGTCLCLRPAAACLQPPKRRSLPICR